MGRDITCRCYFSGLLDSRRQEATIVLDIFYYVFVQLHRFALKSEKSPIQGSLNIRFKDLFLNNFSTCRVKEKFSRNTFQYKIVYYVLFSPYLEHCEIHTIREYTWHGFLQLSLLLHFSLEFYIVLCIESSQRNEEEIELVL